MKKSTKKVNIITMTAKYEFIYKGVLYTYQKTKDWQGREMETLAETVGHTIYYLVHPGKGVFLARGKEAIAALHNEIQINQQ